MEPFYTDEFMWTTLGITELPNKVYHYTSIESLARILKTRSIRFNRLDKVNDPEEATAVDLPNAASAEFVSCWTSNEKESIPLWSIYTPDLSGVRIKMPINMFSGRDVPKIFDKGGAQLKLDKFLSIPRRPPAPTLRTRSVVGPNQVYYTDDERFRNVQCLYEDEYGTRFMTYDLGMVKNTHWKFEEEWRFKVSAFSQEQVHEDGEYCKTILANLTDHPVLLDQLFVPLDLGSLDELVIMLGPRSTEEHRQKVVALIEDYAPSAELQVSQIRIR